MLKQTHCRSGLSRDTAKHHSPGPASKWYRPNVFRYGLLGVADGPVWIACVLMPGFVAVLGGLGLRLLNRRVGLRS